MRGECRPGPFDKAEAPARSAQQSGRAPSAQRSLLPQIEQGARAVPLGHGLDRRAHQGRLDQLPSARPARAERTAHPARLLPVQVDRVERVHRLLVQQKGVQVRLRSPGRVLRPVQRGDVMGDQ